MRDASIRGRIVLVALGISAVSMSCVPMIANVAKGDTVPKVVATRVPNESNILVLPLWLDGRQWNFRDPYVIPASVIGTPEANVPPRVKFYLDSFVCGGPPVFVVGYLVVSEEGSAIWTDVRGENESTSHALIKRELSALMSGQELGPHLRKLMEYEDAEIRLRAGEDDRQAAVRFLSTIPDEQ